jgi:hypothetical protein
MKNVVLIFMLVILSSAFLPAESEFDTGLKISIAKSMEEFSRSYLEVHPSPVSKKGAAVLEIENNSDKAKFARIGELVRAYLEEAMDLSLIFVLTDRANLKKIVDEIKFSASGMVSDDSAVEIGEITGTTVLISGSVSEEGADFRIQLKLTEIETSEVLAVTGFSLPQKDLIDASTEREYSYVAANGIGLSLTPLMYIFGAETFNKAKPMNLDLVVKYRLTREMMLSGGVFINMMSGMDLYRWDPSQYSTQSEVTYGDLQPTLPADFTASGVGQITGDLYDATAFHLDFQYTLNFSPVFNIGLKAGVVNYFRPVMLMRYTSNSGLYYNGSGYDTDSSDAADNLQIDGMPFEYIFESAFGGKIEICPEIFITHRIAVSGVIGYQYILPAVLRTVNASEGQWAYYDMAVASNFSGTAVETYYGLDPVKAPDGTSWTIDFSGLYAGISLSVFF